MDLSEVKQKILSRVSLVQLIGESVQLKVFGDRASGLCPFHAEKSPSFHIFGDHYYCFGCKARGDAIDFVRQQMTPGTGFLDALRFLAKKFGDEAPELEESLVSMKRRDSLHRLYSAMTFAHDEFRKELAKDRGASARSYLSDRGFNASQIERLGFGLTPSEGFGLTRILRLRGFSEDEIKTAGLASVSERTGRPYDFFRDRIIIPIRDAQGRVVSFGGRTLNDDPRKYINGRDTVIFEKAQTLFGLDMAKKAFQTKNRAIVVEGYMDALQLHVQGLEESVACMGTSLNENHLRTLNHSTKIIYLLFDGDNAGLKASLSLVDLSLKHPEAQLKVALLPRGEDPDTFVRVQGKDALETVLSCAQDLLDFAISEKLKDVTGAAIVAKVRSEFVPWLSRVGDRMQRAYLLHKLSMRTGISQAHLEREIVHLLRAPITQKNPDERSKPNISQQFAPIEPLDALLFDLFGEFYFGQPDQLNESVPTVNKALALMHAQTGLSALWTELFDDLVKTLVTEKHSPSNRLISGWRSSLHPTVASFLHQLSDKASAFKSHSKIERIERILTEVRRRDIRAGISALKRQLIIDPQGSNENDLSRTLMLAISQLNQELSNLEKRPT